MECPECGAQMRIVKSAVDVENDDSPDTPTRVWRVQKLKCLNDRCGNEREYEQRHLLYGNQ